jgi:Nuclease-related domain
VARIKSGPPTAGSSLRNVHSTVDAEWRSRRRKHVVEALWWVIPLDAGIGAVAGYATHRAYFGVAFSVLILLALFDVARVKPRAVTAAGRRASGEAATAKALKPLRYHGFTALHDRRLPSNTAPGVPTVDIEHLLIGPAGVFLLDSKNWSAPRPQLLAGNQELWVGRDKRDDALKRLGGDAKNLTVALRQRLPRGVSVEPVMVVHTKEMKHVPRSMAGVTVLLPKHISTVFGGMRQVMSATEAEALAKALDGMLAPKVGDRLAPG